MKLLVLVALVAVAAADFHDDTFHFSSSLGGVNSGLQSPLLTKKYSSFTPAYAKQYTAVHASPVYSSLAQPAYGQHYVKQISSPLLVKSVEHEIPLYHHEAQHFAQPLYAEQQYAVKKFAQPLYAQQYSVKQIAQPAYAHYNHEVVQPFVSQYKHEIAQPVLAQYSSLKKIAQPAVYAQQYSVKQVAQPFVSQYKQEIAQPFVTQYKQEIAQPFVSQYKQEIAQPVYAQYKHEIAQPVYTQYKHEIAQPAVYAQQYSVKQVAQPFVSQYKQEIAQPFVSQYKQEIAQPFVSQYKQEVAQPFVSQYKHEIAQPVYAQQYSVKQVAQPFVSQYSTLKKVSQPALFSQYAAKPLVAQQLSGVSTYAAGYSGPQYRILSQVQESDAINGAYKTSYSTENGIQHVEQGSLIPSSEGSALAAQGSYSYTGPDGQVYTVNYIADENGFRAAGDHLPTPPPATANIAKAIGVHSEQYDDQGRLIYKK